MAPSVGWEGEGIVLAGIDIGAEASEDIPSRDSSVFGVTSSSVVGGIFGLGGVVASAEAGGGGDVCEVAVCRGNGDAGTRA
jgi:hypothetical protein